MFESGPKPLRARSNATVARVHAPRHWRFFALFCAALLIAVAAEACGATPSIAPAVTGDGGDDREAGVELASCPKDAPDAGTACPQPEGTTCAFGVCDGIYAVCTGGVWRQAPVTPVPSGCPEGVPSAGSTCPACFSADASCLYQQACATDASAARASCVGQKWQLVDDTCVVEAGTADGGDGAAGSNDASSDADAAD